MMKWVRLVRDFAPNGWWRRAPFLPVPPREYLLFRLHTMYGFEWPRHWRSIPRDLRQFVTWRERFLKGIRS
jgi:hypothetical protein